MDIVYSDRYQVDIGAHVFHMGKYAKVRDGLVARGLIGPAALVEPEPAGWDELALVHTAEYLEKTRNGGFRASELALLELPWSPEVAEGFRLMAGGTIAAARLAVAAGHRRRRTGRWRGRRRARPGRGGEPRRRVPSRLPVAR